MSDVTQTDTVLVTGAILSPQDDGTKQLTLITRDRVEIQFSLDDMAVALLGLTMSGVIAGLKEKRAAGKSPYFHPKGDNE